MDERQRIARHVLCVSSCSTSATTLTTSNFYNVTHGRYLTLALYRFDSGVLSDHRFWRYLVYSVVQWGWRIDEKRWRKPSNELLIPLLSCLLAFPSSSSTFAAERQKEIKGVGHERHGWDCVSRCPVSLLSPLQIWKCWITNPAGTYDAYSLPQPHLLFFLDSLPSLLPLALTLHHRLLPSWVRASLLQP